MDITAALSWVLIGLSLIPLGLPLVIPFNPITVNLGTNRLCLGIKLPEIQVSWTTHSIFGVDITVPGFRDIGLRWSTRWGCANNPVPGWVESVNNIWALINRRIRNLVPAWARLTHSIRDLIRSLIRDSTTWFSRNVDDAWSWARARIREHTTWWARNIHDLRNWVYSRIDEIVPAWARLTHSIRDLIRVVVDEWLPDWIEAIDDLGDWTENLIFEVLPDWVGEIVDLGQFIVDTVEGWLPGWVQAIEDIGRFLETFIFDTLPDWVGEIWDLTGWLIDQLARIFPIGLLEDWQNWLLHGFLGALLDQLGSGIIWTLREIMEAITHVVLEPETKRDIRDRASKARRDEDDE